MNSSKTNFSLCLKDFLPIEKDLYSLSPKVNDLTHIYYLIDSDGLFHHEDLPALVICSIDFSSQIQYYYHHGILYRKNGPAVESLRVNNAKKQKFLYFYHQDKILKEKSFPLGKEICLEIKSFSLHPLDYLINTKRSAVSGPSHIQLDDLGSLHRYERNEKAHREDGPAILEYTSSGLLVRSYWYLDGYYLGENK